MTANATAEQWSRVLDVLSDYSLPWGPTTIDRYVGDPKRIAFFFARYKFAGKMLRRCQSIVEVGCGDGMGTISFLSDTEARTIVGIDFEDRSIEYANAQLMPAVRALRPDDEARLSFCLGDFLAVAPLITGSPFDGLACLDVIEHIEPSRSRDFIARMAMALKEYGVAVVGAPSLASLPFASPQSRVGHINLYDPDRFRSELEREFRQVFVFSMNDEVVHTGFDKLAHYLLAVCVK